MTKSNSFKVRARVLNQLGEQLIKNESIALLELIKNSYDADASECVIKMYNPDSMDKGKIVIRDDGEGMNYDILTTAWLEIGTNYKETLRKNKKTLRTTLYDRLRLGEKGIGRFGVHRLGKNIEIITRMESSKEYVLTINWEDIENNDFIEDIPIEIKERNPKEFPTGSGTKITISNLRVSWTKRLARNCHRSILTLNSPFESMDSFRVDFTINNSDWLSGLLTYEKIKKYSLFSFDIEMSGNQITKFDYKFTPWRLMTKLQSRKISIKDKEIKELTRMVQGTKKDMKEIDLSKSKIGEVRFKGVIFDRDQRILELGFQDRSGFKQYLNKNGGVRVFRDNMRVMDYGEPGNDWLDLGARRVNIPGKRISNNILLAAIYLDREKSGDLIEKANREGFVENEAYPIFLRSIIYALEMVESLRKTDKDLLRKHYGPNKISAPVITSIFDLRDIVDKKIKEKKLKKNINQYLDRIAKEYSYITDSLFRSAGAGMNIIMVLHQIEKIIKDIKSMLKNRSSFRLIEERVKNLSLLIEGYSILVKESELILRDLKEIIDQSVFNVGFRLIDHHVNINSAFLKKRKNISGICYEGHVLNALMNLFDNSIWWLRYKKVKNREIFIDISSDLPGYISILFADNGPGFTMPTNEIIKPFVSNKPGGIGIGLHLTHEIMKSLGGKLIFPDMEMFSFPEKFKNGAKIVLAFKKG